jgi:membrane-associated protein
MQTIMDTIMQVTPVLAYLAITALVFAEDALFIGFVLPGETAAILGGVLASQHRLHLWLITLLVVLAAIVGDSVGYEVGRHFGGRVLRMRLLRKHEQKLDKARDFLARRGGMAVTLGRFTAFFRAVMPALAGMSRMPYRRFLAFNAAGGILWGTGAVLLGYFAGNAYQTIAKGVGQTFTIGGLAVIAAAAIVWHVRKQRRARAEQLAGPLADDATRPSARQDVAA